MQQLNHKDLTRMKSKDGHIQQHLRSSTTQTFKQLNTKLSKKNKVRLDVPLQILMINTVFEEGDILNEDEEPKSRPWDSLKIATHNINGLKSEKDKLLNLVT